MSESSMWAKLRERVFRGPMQDAERIENRIGIGTPDVNYTVMGHDGWIELKEVKTWPKRPSTHLQVPHYTTEQRNWARRRLAAGGDVWMLLKVGRHEWFLIRGDIAAEYVGRCDQATIRKIARAYWDKAPGHELLDYLGAVI